MISQHCDRCDGESAGRAGSCEAGVLMGRLLGDLWQVDFKRLPWGAAVGVMRRGIVFRSVCSVHSSMVVLMLFMMGRGRGGAGGEVPQLRHACFD
jgi:hypothetical protein